MRKLVVMLRKAGAKEVQLRIASPPVKFPCFCGIDMPSRSELIASSYDVDKIRGYPVPIHTDEFNKSVLEVKAACA
jgi:amidophosphoribosyltransferase